VSGAPRSPLPIAPRVALTLALPVVYAAAARIPVLGVSSDGVARLGLDPTLVGVFALGISPALSGYLLVELASVVVPRWARLRNGGPWAQGRLVRAAIVTAVLLAAFQAFGVSLYLEGLGASSELPTLLGDDYSRLLFWGTLTAGACVSILFAQAISRLGLLNGFVALALIVPFSAGGITAAGTPNVAFDVRGFALLAAGVLVVAMATLIAVIGFRPRERDARAWIPVPSCSIAPIGMAASLVVLLTTLTSISGLTDHAPRLVALRGVLTLLIALGFALAFQPPGRVQEALGRLGAAEASPGVDSVRAEVRAALAPSLALVACLFFASIALEHARMSLTGSTRAALGVALLVDCVASLHAHWRRSDWVPVWSERRAWAVPAIERLLASERIESFTRNRAEQTLLRFFGPFVLSEILVPAPSAKRARQLIARRLLRERKVPAATSESTERAPRSFLSDKRAPLVVIALFASIWVAHRSFAPLPPAPRRAVRLEVVRVDDAAPVFEPLEHRELPRGVGIFVERVPLGPDADEPRRYAVIRMNAGETPAAALARARQWAAGVTLPTGDRIGFGSVIEEDNDGNYHATGFRSYVLTGAPILTQRDVEDAVARVEPDAEPSVDVALRPEGAARFEQATRELVHRRLAIVIDDQVESAPRVLGPIAGGHVRITMGANEHDRMVEEARQLAAGLGGR
jgi:hypothetical protein